MGDNWSDFDPDEFTHFLDDTDLSEEAKREYVEFVWRVVSEFAALGFGEHPVQQAQRARERDQRQDTDSIRKMVADFVESERK